MGLLVARSVWSGSLLPPVAPLLLLNKSTMWQATFFQKVMLCAIAGFLAAGIIEWGKMFVVGADDALNKGYKHTAVFDSKR